MKQITNYKAGMKISRIESIAGTKLQWAEEQIESDIMTFCALDVCGERYQKICTKSQWKNKVAKLEIAAKQVIWNTIS